MAACFHRGGLDYQLYRVAIPPLASPRRLHDKRNTCQKVWANISIKLNWFGIRLIQDGC